MNSSVSTQNQRSRPSARRLAVTSLLLASVCAAFLLGGWLLSGDRGVTGVFGQSDQRIEELEKRLDALETTQQKNHEKLMAELARMAAGGTQRPLQPTPEQLAKRDANRLHRQRLRENPEYLLQHQTSRLNALQAEVMAEAVDPDWSEQASHHVNEVIESSIALSGSAINGASVDCRSTQCRISLEIPRGSSYEELLMHMNTDLAELLPRSRLVVMPSVDGVQQVHIFARTGDPNADIAPTRD